MLGKGLSISYGNNSFLLLEKEKPPEKFSVLSFLILNFDYLIHQNKSQFENYTYSLVCFEADIQKVLP